MELSCEQAPFMAFKTILRKLGATVWAEIFRRYWGSFWSFFYSSLQKWSEQSSQVVSPRPPSPLLGTLYWDAQQKQKNWTHNHCCFPTKQADTLKPWRIDWGNTFKWSGVSFIIVLHYINNIEQKSSCSGLILCRPLSSIPVAWGRFRTFGSFANMYSTT